MATLDLESRLSGIERRLERVEREVGVVGVPFGDLRGDGANIGVVCETASGDRPIPAGPVVFRAEPPPLPVPAIVPSPVPQIRAVALRRLQYEPKAPKKQSPTIDSALEQMIGLKLAGWVGAIVLVIGAGFGIKYAYDQGWLGGVPPAMRLVLMYLGGFGLIAAGEYVYRRINVISAAGLFGAGVATLFLVSYAGNAYYGLYARQTAFALMAISTIIGAAVAMRGKLVSIAVLSLLGGYLSPIVLQGDRADAASLGAYLLMLQVVALVLSWWGARPKWWALRGLSLSATALWTASMLIGAPPWGAAMWFALVYATLYQVEVILTARRGTQAVDQGAAVAFSAIVTTLITMAILGVLQNETAAIRGIWMCAFSAIAVIGAIVLRFGESNRQMSSLAYGYRIQAAALLLLAVPVAFSGCSVAIGWAALAIVLAAIGAKLNDRLARWAGVCAWLLSLLDLVHWTNAATTSHAAHTIALTLFGQPIFAWTLLACGLSAAGQLIAFLHGAGRSGEETGDKDPTVLSILASIVFGIAVIVTFPPLGATGVLLGYAWILCGIDILGIDLALGAQALAVLILAAIKWVAIDTLAGRFAPDWSATAYSPVLNSMTLTGVAIAGMMIAMYRLRRGVVESLLQRDGKNADGVGWVVALAATFVLLWAGTFEIDRLVVSGSLVGSNVWPAGQLRQFTWTAWWIAGVMGYLTIVDLRDRTAIRRLSVLRGMTTLPIVLAAKYLVIDTLGFYLAHGSANATVVMNLQTFAGVIVFGSLLLVREFLSDEPTSALRGLAGALAVVVLLWLGTMEIDRAFARSAIVRAAFVDPRLAEQVALSIFFSAFAIGSVACGFQIRAAQLRYLGLALFAFTLMKVAVVDLREATLGYRILSFMGLGSLLLVTSVLYGKLSPVLLGTRGASPAAK